MRYNKLFFQTLVVGCALLLSGGIAYATGTTWTAPVDGAPPGCTSGNPGCDEPINISTNPQFKGSSSSGQGLLTLYGGVVSASVTGLNLTNTGCLQASNTGLITATGNPCGSSSSGTYSAGNGITIASNVISVNSLATCSSGEASRWTGTAWVCTPTNTGYLFGGMYETTLGGVCAYDNALTGACNCPSGYTNVNTAPSNAQVYTNYPPYGTGSAADLIIDYCYEAL